MVPGSHIVPFADCYRCPIGAATVVRPRLRRPRAKAAQGRVRRRHRAIIVEPIQGTAGKSRAGRLPPAVASLARSTTRSSSPTR